MNATTLRSAALYAAPLVLIATLVLGVSYVNDQQTLRQLAYEPQNYVTADTALRLAAAGAIPESGFSSAVPIEQDPAVYLTFYNASGTPVAGTGILNGQPPVLPAGVLATAKTKGIDRLTWEPAKGVRQAIVVMPAADGWVMSGRSLAFTEAQEQQLLLRTVLGWVITVILIALVTVLLTWRKRERKG